MTSFLIRPATLADAPAISAVHGSNVTAWKTWQADGSSRPARYTDLTPYQRWLNGGPWLDPDTCAFHLNRFVNGGGFALVAEMNGRVVATAELGIADEPPPYGRNLNLSALYVHRNHHGQGFGSALVKYALALAEEHYCETFTVANTEAPDFYRKHGLKLAERWIEYEVPARSNLKIPLYRIGPLNYEAYSFVQGWALPIGRHQNAHHAWARTLPDAVPDFEEWRHIRLERYRLNLGYTLSAVIYEEMPSLVGVANVFVFLKSGFVNETFVDCIRHHAARSGFTSLHCLVRSGFSLPDATPTGYKQDLFLKRL